ncbi:MAG TPA: hypothetical protein VMF90_23140 [Rhizobiaceae bacterium]|nr:hypothetical protein [Rhizobiaceae bacterium]
MVSRTDRLKKLVEVQEQLKALHEAKRAGYVARAMAAGEEAADLARRADQHTEITAAFPDLYNRRIEQALARQTVNDGLAKKEAGKVATATLRTNIVERAYREAARLEERQDSDKELLEIIGRMPPKLK